MNKYLIFAGISLLAACQPAEPEVAVVTPTVLSPADTVFEEREPDLCKAINYVPYLSQPGSVVASLGIEGPYRVVAWRGIEAQEYNPQRVTFRLDAAGNIYNIDCG
ncbi:hypothetical protein [Albirhodobacter sp. R86504]|uniref:hypothetical protein n=1 Tax=Albirhodobacter sp. R86504 TaxID=3093848 RepID=UPI00367061A5